MQAIVWGVISLGHRFVMHEHLWLCMTSMSHYRELPTPMINTLPFEMKLCVIESHKWAEQNDIKFWVNIYDKVWITTQRPWKLRILCVSPFCTKVCTSYFSYFCDFIAHNCVLGSSEDLTELWQYQLPGNREQWLEGPGNILLSKITHAQGETNQGSGTRYPCEYLWDSSIIIPSPKCI